MKYVISVTIVFLLSIWFMGCKPIEKVVIQKEIVNVKTDCKCDTIEQAWADTLWFVLPCDSAVIGNRGEHTDLDIKTDKGVVSGKIITKQRPEIIRTVRKDSIVYVSKEIPIYCDKTHVEKWNIYTFIVSLLLNVIGILFLIKKFM